MPAYNDEKRWELLHVSVKDECFIVLDKLAKKRRVYHVPYLTHAELVHQAVYVHTSSAKIMQLDLLTATRQFISPLQLKRLMLAEDALQIRKTAAKNTKQPFAKIALMANSRFFDTVRLH